MGGGGWAACMGILVRKSSDKEGLVGQSQARVNRSFFEPFKRSQWQLITERLISEIRDRIVEETTAAPHELTVNMLL